MKQRPAMALALFGVTEGKDNTDAGWMYDDMIILLEKTGGMGSKVLLWLVKSF